MGTRLENSHNHPWKNYCVGTFCGPKESKKMGKMERFLEKISHGRGQRNSPNWAFMEDDG